MISSFISEPFLTTLHYSPFVAAVSITLSLVKTAMMYSRHTIVTKNLVDLDKYGPIDSVRGLTVLRFNQTERVLERVNKKRSLMEEYVKNNSATKNCVFIINYDYVYLFTPLKYCNYFQDIDWVETEAMKLLRDEMRLSSQLPTEMSTATAVLPTNEPASSTSIKENA